MCSTINKLMTTKDVAKALGVSESSIKRWIDDGLLKAGKTPGGHRRISVSDLDEFIQSTGKKIRDRRPIGVPDSVKLDTFSDVFTHFSLSLRNGDIFLMRAIIRKLLLEGDNIDSIIDRLIFPSFRELRSECQHPSEECLVLHRAVDMVRNILDLQNREGDEVEGSAMILADLGYEIDGLPTFFAEATVKDYLLPVQLGTGVPEEVVVGALDKVQAPLVFLSASGPVRNRKLLDKRIDTILSVCARRGIPCYLYGDHFDGKRHASKTIRKIHSFSELRGTVNA